MSNNGFFRVSLALILLCSAVSGATVASSDELVFGDQWKPFYLNLTNEQTELIASGWKDLITLPPPPNNVFTRNEVQDIVALKALRARYQDQIDAQIRDVTAPFSAGLALNAKQRVALRSFWQKVLPDVARVTFHFKAKFDRARPRQYSREVMPSIAPPGHPAYPSGHSTDAHSLALLLAEIWPERTTQLLTIAQRIAVNREIAGVHYRSDTVAGHLLAQQVVALMIKNSQVDGWIEKLRSVLST